MKMNLRKLAAGGASALLVLFMAACAAQPTQDATKPATQTSEAPAEQTAPAAAAPAEAAPATGEAQPAQQTAPAQGQPAQPQQ